MRKGGLPARVILIETLEQRQLLSTIPAPVATGQGSGTSPGTQLVTTSPTFAWNAVSGVSGMTGYQINCEDETASKFYSFKVGTSVTTASLPASELVAGDKFVWNVRTVEGSTTGPESNYLYFQVPAAAPIPAPVATGQGSASAPGSTLDTSSPTFRWSAVTGVSGMTGYQINCEDETADKFYSFQVGTSVTSYSLPSADIVAGDDYVWNVRTVEGSTTGPESNYLYFAVPAAAALPAPVAVGQGTVATPGPELNTAQPTFQWDAVTGVSGLTGYQINIENTTANTFASYQVGTSVTSYTPPAGELIAGDSYVWNVRILEGSTSGPPSAYLNFQVPAAVTLPAPMATGPGSSTKPGPVLTASTPTLTWNAVTGVTGLTGYQIYLTDETAGKTYSYQTGASVTSFTVPAGTLAAGDVFVWNVRVLVGSQSGPPSTYLYFQTPAATTAPRPATLPAPVATGPGGTVKPGSLLTTLTPTLQWNAVTGVTGLTGYQIYLTDETAGKTYSYQTGASVTSFTVPAGTLAAGDVFVWNVRVLVGSQSGPPSTYLYFQTPAATTTSSNPPSPADQITADTEKLTRLEDEQHETARALKTDTPGTTAYEALLAKYDASEKRIKSLKATRAELEAEL